MKVTMEDVARTICLGAWEHDYTPRDPKYPDVRWIEAMDAARAVLEKHIGPMIAGAYRDGSTGIAVSMTMTAMGRLQEPVATPEQYAARIISSLTEPQDRRKTDEETPTR